MGAHPRSAPVHDRYPVLSSKARDTFRHVTEPAGHALARAGITANSLTAVGLAGAEAAGEADRGEAVGGDAGLGQGVASRLGHMAEGVAGLGREHWWLPVVDGGAPGVSAHG